MSQQAWAIVGKIKQVDEILCQNPALQQRIREVHPEVSFYVLAGDRPMQYSKKSRAGRAERRNLLEPIFGQALRDALAKTGNLDAAEDDILDAVAVLWSARRIADGVLRSISPATQLDSCGLTMEIVV